MKVLGIVITYYPKIDELIENISKFIGTIDTLIIWQNTLLQEHEKNLLNNIFFYKEIILMGNGQNKGIAYALNKAFDMMVDGSNNYTHLLTMDQDSTWVNFDNYCDEIKLLPQNAIYSPNINNEYPSGTELIQVKTCITSGALFSGSVLKDIGKFNEEYSVDCVDYDFCFKAFGKGICIYKVQKANLNQIYGEPMKSKYFNLENNVYSPERLFFIARNHILLWRDYPEHMDFHFKRIILSSHIFGKIVKITFMENSKIRKITSILKGFFAGLLNNRKASY